MRADEYIDVMGGLSVLELSELVMAIEEKFNIQANPKLIMLKDEKEKDWYRKFEKKKKSTRIK